MEIHAPKEKPAIQVVCASGWKLCTQSSAAAASLSSPIPLSNTPCERPTPRKLKRKVAKPRFTKVLYSAWVMRSFIVPPALRMGVEDQRNRCTRAGRRAEAPLKAPLGTGKNDVGHGTWDKRTEGRRAVAAAAGWGLI